MQEDRQPQDHARAAAKRSAGQPGPLAAADRGAVVARTRSKDRQQRRPPAFSGSSGHASLGNTQNQGPPVPSLQAGGGRAAQAPASAAGRQVPAALHRRVHQRRAAYCRACPAAAQAPHLRMLPAWLHSPQCSPLVASHTKPLERSSCPKAEYLRAAWPGPGVSQPATADTAAVRAGPSGSPGDGNSGGARTVRHAARDGC
jgi:hypothetical protein